MIVEKRIVAILKAGAAVTNLIGGASAPRLHPNKLPQGAALPALVYQLVGLSPVVSLDGDNSDLDRGRVQITSIGESYASAKNLAAAVRAVLALSGAIPETELDDYDDETQRHRVISDFYLWSDQ